MNYESPDLVELTARLVWITTALPDLLLAVAEDDGTLTDETLLVALPEPLHTRADTIADPEERRHFLFRRAVQQVFVAQVISWPGPVRTLPLVHGLDQRPRCSDAPQVCLSFSTSGPVCLLGASRAHVLGVDIERLRRVENAGALAQRFFTAEEAAEIESRDPSQQSECFLTLWVGKEAGLKAKGVGIDSGLNTFVFRAETQKWAVRDQTDPSTATAWRFLMPAWRSGFILGVMHRPAVSQPPVL